jgi:hypothetical protein
MTLTRFASRVVRLRRTCRNGHLWTKLSHPPACRICGRTRQVVR